MHTIDTVPVRNWKSDRNSDSPHISFRENWHEILFRRRAKAGKNWKESFSCLRGDRFRSLGYGQASPSLARLRGGEASGTKIEKRDNLLTFIPAIRICAYVQCVISAPREIFLYFSLLFFHLAGISEGRVGLRIAPWVCINPYIRLNPSPRKFRRGSAGGPTRDRSLFRFLFLFSRATHAWPSPACVRKTTPCLPAIRGNSSPLCSRRRGCSCCRLLLLRKCRGSRVVRLMFSRWKLGSRSCCAPESRNFVERDFIQLIWFNLTREIRAYMLLLFIKFFFFIKSALTLFLLCCYEFNIMSGA